MPDRRTGYYVAGRDWPAMGSGIPLEDLYRGLEGITEGGPAPMSDQPAEAVAEIPAEYVKAAAGAMQRHCDNLGIEVPSGPLACALALAAWPHLAEAAQEKAVAAAVAAERERICQLARDHGSHARPCGTCRQNGWDWVPFANLIGGQP